MGLKKNIYLAFEKNLGKEFVNADEKYKKKIDDLSDDLSKAIIDFITAQTFRVDKLSASGGPVSISPAPLMSTLAAVGAPVFTTVPPIAVVTVDVDKDGGPSPAGGGVLHSNQSEVRLRKGEVAEK